MARAGVQLFGDKELMRMFKNLGDKDAKKMATEMSKMASAPVVQTAKANAPVESGLLRKSIGRVTRSYKRGFHKVAVVGPRAGFHGMVAMKIKGVVVGKPKKRNPLHYAHLVEYGHVGRDGAWVAAKPFIRPAYDAIHGQGIELMRKAAWQVIDKATARNGAG